MARAGRCEQHGILRAEQRDDAGADRGGDVHRPAVVAEQEVELCDERGELRDRQGLINDRLAGARMEENLVENFFFSGSGNQDHPGPQFASDPAAKLAKSFRRPEPKRTP